MKSSLIKNPNLKYRRLGSSDLEVSVLGLGCFAFGGDHETMAHLGKELAKLHANVWGPQDEKDTFETVKAALDAGINYFDNAESYGGGHAEEAMGRALKASGYDRSEYAIATKVSEAYLSPELLREHLEQSLKRIGTDYIDVYQIHWHSRAALKSERYPDRPLTEEVPLETTLQALDQLRKEGKIRHIGVCNFGVQDLTRAINTGIPIVSNQISYSLLWRGIEDSVVPLCIKHNISILPWGPILQGLLAGKFTPENIPEGRARSRLFANTRPAQRHGEPGLEKEVWEALKHIEEISKKVPASMSDTSLAWLLHKPGVTSLMMGSEVRDHSQLRTPITQMVIHPAITIQTRNLITTTAIPIATSGRISAI